MKRAAFLLMGLAFVLAVFASPFASGLPDGLERVAEVKGFLHKAENAKSAVKAPMAGYSLPGVRDDRASTGLAGGVGTLLVLGLGYGLSFALRRKRG